jgi:nucleotide-binding universal stress UspA family protein
MKSVLLHVQDDNGLEARLQAALCVVRATNGHLSCLHVTPINAYVAFDGFGGVFVMNDIMKALEEHETKMRTRIEGRLAHEDVSWDYSQITAEPTHALVSHGALNDLIVVGRGRHHETAALPGMTLIGDLLHATRTPLLIQPEKQDSFDPLGPAVVAWNGSFEAANAMRFVLPLLKQSSAVHIVTVEDQKETAFPSVAASEYLSRHGILTELHTQKSDSKSVGDALIASAQMLKASYLVMGAYGHSRAREYLFGGVTRHMLKDCPVPILIAH